MAATVSDLAARVLRRLGVAAVAEAARPGVDTAATYTLPEIGAQALRRLGVVAAGEAPEPADRDHATNTAAAVMEGLIVQGISIWGAGQTIPRSVAEDFTTLTALQLAPSYGKPADPAGVPVVEARLRRIAMLAGARPVAAQAVMDVHSHLSARGMARWSVFDIPDYAEGPYVALAANLVAPQFDLPADPLAEARAMRELALVTALPSSGETMRPEWF